MDILTFFLYTLAIISLVSGITLFVQQNSGSGYYYSKIPIIIHISYIVLLSINLIQGNEVSSSHISTYLNQQNVEILTKILLLNSLWMLYSMMANFQTKLLGSSTRIMIMTIFGLLITMIKIVHI